MCWPTHRPDLAVIDTRTGKPWIDNEKLAWVDPFREEVWDYLIAIAKEAVAKGFDEVQFDYVRFPTDGQLVRRRLRAAEHLGHPAARHRGLPGQGAPRAGPDRGRSWPPTSSATPPSTPTTPTSGSAIEELAPHLDYICPMVYPSGYHLGIPGFRNPVTHPYEIVRESVRLIRQRTQHTAVQVRPWLQDFRDYAFDRRIFGTREIRAQIKGGVDGGGVGLHALEPAQRLHGGGAPPQRPPCPRRPPPQPCTRDLASCSPSPWRGRSALSALAAGAGDPPSNELGRVMILEYHKIDRPEGRWTRTPENFRRDLQRALGARLSAGGPQRLPRRARSPCRAGTTPVILTFDDSSPGQFRYLERNGDWVLDPDCAVGILEAFEREHPGFGHAATFYVLPGADPAQPPLQPARPGRPASSQYLASRGYEIGNHTLWHATLGRYPETVVREQVASARRTGCSATSPAIASAPSRSRWAPTRGARLGRRGPGSTASTYRHDAILMVAAAPRPGAARARASTVIASRASRR